jgi:hypothetical protein
VSHPERRIRHQQVGGTVDVDPSRREEGAVVYREMHGTGRGGLGADREGPRRSGKPRKIDLLLQVQAVEREVDGFPVRGADADGAVHELRRMSLGVAAREVGDPASGDRECRGRGAHEGSSLVVAYRDLDLVTRHGLLNGPGERRTRGRADETVVRGVAAGERHEPVGGVHGADATDDQETGPDHVQTVVETCGHPEPPLSSLEAW